MNNEIINDLLVLRSGLSYISLKADETRKELNKKKSMQAAYKQKKAALEEKRLEYTSNLTKKKRSEANLKSVDIVREKQNLEKTSSELKDTSLLKTFPVALGVGVAAFIVVLIVGAIIYGIIKLIVKDEVLAANLDNMSIPITTGTGILAFTITFNFFVYKRKKERRRIKKQAKENYDTLVYRNQTALDSATTKLERLKKEIEFKTNDLDSFQTSCENQFQQIAISIKVLKNEAEIMYSYLKDTYKEILNPMDWENLDLIIYYLETGRADSVKDALMQMDRQIQVNTIVVEVQKASIAIRSTIQNEMQNLREIMIKCSIVISKQITDMHNSIIRQNKAIMDTINDQTSIVSKQTSEIISQQELMNSLQKKANAQSQELLNDYKYVHSL